GRQYRPGGVRVATVPMPVAVPVRRPVPIAKRLALPVRPKRSWPQRDSGHGPVVVSGPSNPSPGLIPNVIHFVYGFKEQTEPLELYKYLAMRSAIDLNQPAQVCFHYWHEPFGPWWD